MNDKLIFSDGRNLYITLESKIKSGVKWFLIVLNFLLYGLIISLFVSMDDNQKPSLLFPCLMFSGAVFYFLTRPTMWNILGKESIVITRKSFSYHRDYGFFSTNFKTVDISNGLAISSEEQFVYKPEKYVTISFFEYDEHDLPSQIFATSIKTPMATFKRISELVDELYKEPDEMDLRFSVN